jgi:hypothetical protein
MIQQQLATATQELHKSCAKASTTMTLVSLLNIHLEEADAALEAGKFKDAQHCLNLFWKVIREGQS